MKFVVRICILLVLAVAPLGTHAQEKTILNGLPVIDLDLVDDDSPKRDMGLYAIEDSVSGLSFDDSGKTLDKKFWTLAALLVATTVVDVETTFNALDRCSRCEEANPLMKPFIERGRVATYAVTLGIDAWLLHNSYQLKKSGERKWWLFLAAPAATHGIAGALNLRF